MGTFGTSMKFKTASVVLAVLAAAGVGTWIYQLMNGLGVTGMNNSTSWGLYITCFMFFVGLSAGGLIVASSASVFHIAQFKKVAVPAIILSTVCICCAGMFVLIDLGGIQRIWNVLVSPNPMSPLLWDICVITCYLVINILYLYFMTSKRANPHAVSIISRFALPIAILVHSVTAWIFGLQLAREAWHSAIMAPIFVASAMDSGLALLLIVLLALQAAKVFELGRKLMATLAGLLATCIAVDAFFIGCELLTVAYPQTAGGMETLGTLFNGVTSPFFWFEIIAGLLIPFCILVFSANRQRPKLVILASALVVVGVFFKRVWLLFTAFVHPNVYGAPGISSGSSAGVHAGATDIWSTLGVYAPTWVEIVVVVGVVSLGALAFLVLASKLLKPSDEPVTAPRETAAQVA
ncbi:NrfD/PsrC family molybdoenzyme membrane anchor subunit [Eggerthella guodeyinii]